MPFDVNKVDLVLQFALLVAGQEDDYSDQQLGPIHLIKYVYLADLEYAKRNNGETYTGTDWRFYKFGPWSQSVNARIEPALTIIHANHIVFQSDYEDREDWIRWSKYDKHLLQEREEQLPTCITHRLKRDIHKCGKDTSALLDYVYKTNPMLSAAPNESLDFSLVVEIVSNNKVERPQLRMENLSAKRKKKFNEGMRAIRERQQSKELKKGKLITPPAPRYDEIYNVGITWLNSLAGPEFVTDKIVAEFSEDVWNSSTRKDKDVS